MDGELHVGIRPGRAAPPRIALLGGEVDLVTHEMVLDFTAAAIVQGRRAVVANHNLHSLALLRSSAPMRRFYALADLIEVDSTPLILWGRMLGRPIGRDHRCTYLDWREAFWRRAAAKGWRVFYLGGAPGMAERGAAAVRGRWPGAAIATHHGCFDPEAGGTENQAVLAEIRAFAPDVLFVGMGMPRQEVWILDNHGRLAPCVAFSIGAAFDYEAGAVPTPPRWSGRLGVEWLFRLAREPRRLAHRYLVEPWILLGPALRDLAGARKP